MIGVNGREIGPDVRAYPPSPRLGGAYPRTAEWANQPMAEAGLRPIELAMTTGQAGHRLAGYHYDSETGEHEARCSCGWVSEPYTDSQQAGEVWERHLDGESTAEAR